MTPVIERLRDAFPMARVERHGRATVVEVDPGQFPAIAEWLVNRAGALYATMVLEEEESRWRLCHLFFGPEDAGLFELVSETPIAEGGSFPSIAAVAHGADWHEREAEDLFGVVFEGHPRLGDFVLHAHWPEGVNPMRRSFDASAYPGDHDEEAVWQPLRLLDAPGAFVMPIGPVYSDYAESAHFLLETVGEDVVRALPRFFYKYRAVEKLACGRTVEEALLYAERFSGTSAFGHALAFCQAVEAIGEVPVPPRARRIRLFLSELERIRHHLSVLAGLCGSTGLAVGKSHMAILEEELLRIMGDLVRHRYLFGICLPGGLARDLSNEALRLASERTAEVAKRLDSLVDSLTKTSSFLDRIEEVGIITPEEASHHALTGPVARASGLAADLRVNLPYGDYSVLQPASIPCESEGDGYARLRVFHWEARESAALMKRAASAILEGSIRAAVPKWPAGAAFGIAETPAGAAFHFVRLKEDGRILRYRLGSPAFTNWHGFHLAAENFAFQDFPIIMASLGLSIAEADR